MTANTKWQLTGNAAELYEQFLVPTIFIPWAQHVLARVTPAFGEHVLDVACGTGIVARMTAARVGPSGHVSGVDLNPGMLEVARSIVSDGSINWVQADVADIPLGDNEFDKAYCQQGLQFFPDKVAALTEIARLLKPGGTCVAVVAGPLDQNPLMKSQVQALEKTISAEAANGIRAVCGLPDAGTIAGLFEEAGYQDIQASTEDLTLFYPDGHEFVRNGIMSTPLAALIADWDLEKKDGLISEILSGFGSYFDGKSLIFPHVSNVVIAKAA
ncbi:methyltransferase domain-containing protein [Sneathiella limimaris]|uniref:methyltransferase domain-containing protein n=1 Tax=Sneathiella limimaris TaxID=1964213 RepID=UPI00146BCE94|nr:methyltransferase domain-containing protein [Sneathiella limimaris]